MTTKQKPSKPDPTAVAELYDRLLLFWETREAEKRDAKKFAKKQKASQKNVQKLPVPPPANQ